MHYLAGTDSVHTTAAICDYLDDRATADDAVTVIAVAPSDDPTARRDAGEALNVANQQDAYTLSDRGTFISQRSEIDLVILVQGPIEGGPELLSNPYGVIAVNPAVHENVNYDLAMAYIGWITSPGVQTAISEYQVNGEQLFFPEAVSEDPDFQQYVPEGWSSDSADE